MNANTRATSQGLAQAAAIPEGADGQLPPLEQVLHGLQQIQQQQTQQLQQQQQQIQQQQQQIQQHQQQLQVSQQQTLEQLHDLRHHTMWGFYGVRSELRNSRSDQRVAMAWTNARMINRSRVDLDVPLIPLCLPFPVQQVEAPPPPPPLGQPLLDPPALAAEPPLLPPHELFPATRNDLARLT
ncbi:hypothetical protein DL93DRAFT_2229271, partial [Clavulina sp. PMI_390]